MNRRLVVLGTGTGRAVRERNGPACLVEAGESRLLLDCGEGTAAAMRAQPGWPLLDVLMISHLHPDHVAGFLVLIQNLTGAGRSDPLDVFIPNGGEEPLRKLLGMAYLTQPWLGDREIPLRFHQLEIGQRHEFNCVTAQVWQSDHFSARDPQRGLAVRPAFGFSLETGKGRLVYSGDIASTDCLAEELDDRTTLVCEALHVDWEKVTTLAGSRKVIQLIFTHCDPGRWDELETMCDSQPWLEAARDGMEYPW